MDDNTGGQDERLLARTQAGYWRLLRQGTRPTHGDYLELGPDIGLFTRAAATDPALGKFWLVEPNRAVHGKLVQAAGAKPHVLLDNLAAVERIPDGSLALAVAVHVLDHLLEPQPLLERIVRKLAPGGRVLAVTHNERSLAARCFGARWPAFCLQHPQLYAPATLRGEFPARGPTRHADCPHDTTIFPSVTCSATASSPPAWARSTFPCPPRGTSGSSSATSRRSASGSSRAVPGRPPAVRRQRLTHPDTWM